MGIQLPIDSYEGHVSTSIWITGRFHNNPYRFGLICGAIHTDSVEPKTYQISKILYEMFETFDSWCTTLPQAILADSSTLQKKDNKYTFKRMQSRGKFSLLPLVYFTAFQHGQIFSGFQTAS